MRLVVAGIGAVFVVVPWIDPLLFAIACVAGGGGLLSIGLGVTTASERRGLRLGMHAVLAIVAIGLTTFGIAALAAHQPLALWGSAATWTALYILLIVLPSPAFGRLLDGLRSAAHSPRARRGMLLALWVLCPFAGLGLVYAQLELATELSADDLAAAQAETTVPSPEVNPDSSLITDLGRIVRTLRIPGGTSTPTPALLAAQDRLLDRFELHGKVIYVPNGWQDTNCHGFVFTDGRYFIGGKEVDPILSDNGYEPVYSPRPGDVAIYRDADGEAQHSGIVRGVASDGVVLVESKFGQAGRFIHPHNRHPYPDTACTFYRSARPGHLLHGVYATPAAPSTLPPTPANPPAPQGSQIL
jgi:hypothetical protein